MDRNGRKGKGRKREGRKGSRGRKYTVNQKKRGSLFLSITLANLNRFL